MIIQPNRLDAIRRHYPEASIGYTSGVFDLFHRGHINYIEACKRACDVLVVGVDSDRLTRLRKGGARPIQSVAERMHNVDRHANYVFAKDAPSEYYARSIHPDFYFFSKDNVVSSEKRKILALSPCFKDAVFIPYTEDISTTEILTGSMRNTIQNT